MKTVAEWAAAILRLEAAPPDVPDHLRERAVAHIYGDVLESDFDPPPSPPPPRQRDPKVMRVATDIMAGRLTFKEAMAMRTTLTLEQRLEVIDLVVELEEEGWAG